MVISAHRPASSGFSTASACKFRSRTSLPSDGFRTNRVNDRRNVHDAQKKEKTRRARRTDPCRSIFAPKRAANSRLLNRDQTSAAYVSYRTEAENRAH